MESGAGLFLFGEQMFGEKTAHSRMDGRGK
jgi:hypothetical protein